MFRMTPSELKVRTYLALALLMAGILVARSKAAGLTENKADLGRQGAPVVSSISGTDQNKRLQATDPAQFTFASGQYQIVMIYAPWDRISQDAAQLMHNFEAKYRDQVRFSYLDVSDPKNKAALQKLGYLFYPQFAFLDDQGRLLAQWTTPSAEQMTMVITQARLPSPLW